VIWFISRRRYDAELGAAKLREEMLQRAIDGALQELRRAQHATAPFPDCVRPAMNRLSRAQIDVSTIRSGYEP
jgi:hypothetical protein